LFEALPEQVFIVDGFEGPVLAANGCALRAWGAATIDELDAKSLMTSVWLAVDPLTQRTVLDVVSESGMWQGQAPIVGMNSSVELCEVAVVAVNDLTRSLHVVFLRSQRGASAEGQAADPVSAGLESSLVTQALELQQKYLDETVKASVDPLTGLRNRRAFDAELAERLGAGTVALLLFDLDHFKQVNDTHGHPAGDEVLRRAAKVLSAGLRSADQAYRLGGEEFGVLLPLADERVAAGVAERLRAAVAAEDMGGLRVTTSVGVAVGGKTSGSPDVLYHEADRALYRAKRNGRNQVVVADDRPARTA
jgi:diguanylate cyclase (GGDEF)-like protein